MRTHTKLIFAGMIAVIALSLAVSAASALRSIQINGLEAGGAMNFSGRITFHKSGEARNSIACKITVLRTMSRVIPKVAGTRMGRVVGFAIDIGREGEHCTSTEQYRRPVDIIPLIALNTSGVARELGAGVLLYDLRGAAAELWTLIYDGFRGSLPNITNIDFHIEKAQLLFKFEFLGTNLQCLSEGRLYLTIIFPREGATRGESVTERTRLGSEERNCLTLFPATWEGPFAISPAITKTLL